eukprot:jgi/Ulvmu1/10740/UM068_0028.1
MCGCGMGAAVDIWSLGVATSVLLTGDRDYPTTTLINAPEAAQVAAGHPVTRRSSGDTSPFIGRGPLQREKEAVVAETPEARRAEEGGAVVSG